MEILTPQGSFLEGKDRNDFTQFGEDGLIEAVLSRIGEKNQWCFEVGAADGVFYSNTLRLRNLGWQAVLIEADDENYRKLELFARPHEIPIHEKIDHRSLDRILTNCLCPSQPDLGVIDIDSQDYWVWKCLDWFSPRVILIEFCPNAGRFVPPLGGLGQATFEPIKDLAIEKGYLPLAKTTVNLLAVKADCFV